MLIAGVGGNRIEENQVQIVYCQGGQRKACWEGAI
jgi:hypothetical protein